MASSVTESIDKEIGYYMVDEGIGVGQMAERLGMTANSLRAKRRGEQDWKWKEVLMLSKMTGKGIDELIGRKGE